MRQSKMTAVARSFAHKTACYALVHFAEADTVESLETDAATSL